ncbi:protein KIAA0100 [Ixodes scapularis]|uniref:protein KIAA0100 n=1 Tax=Ixodes scapularis TaxID=6945 RepID=UPI001A9FE976|nr:protein KIAA0100 [Ixodes scapularis]
MMFLTFLGVFLLLFLACCILVGVASRTLSWYLSRALQQRYDIKLKIGRFGFFSIQEVYLQFRDGTTLEVEQVWFTSSLFSTKYSSLFVVCLGDVRLQAHFDKLLENKPTKRLPPDKPPAQGKIQLPGKAMTFFKRMSLHVHNASIMQLGAPSQDCLLHATFQELAMHVLSDKLDCCISMNMISAALRIFKHPQDTSTNDSCMVHFCVSIQSSITCSAVDLRVIHNASVDIRQPEILLYEDKLLEALSSREAPTSQELEHEEPEHDEEANVASSDKEPTLGEDELRSLVGKLPEAVCIKMESSSFKILRENFQRGLFLEVHSVTAELLRDAGEDSFATCLLTLSNLGLASDQFQVVSLKSAEAKFRLHHEQVDMNVRLASLHAAYSEEELNHWGRLLPPRRRSASVPAPHRSRSQSSLDKLVSLRMLVRATAELEDVSAQLKMTDCGPFSTGLVHARLNADIGSVLPVAGKDKGTRDISSEVMLETAWCTLSPVDVPRPQQLKKSHFWNVPFSVGMMLLKTRHTSQDLRIQCMLGSVHAEVNPRVTALLQQWCSRITSRMTLGRPGGASRAASPTLSVHLSLSDTNVFGVSSAETTLVARLDTLNVDCGTGKVYLNMDGCAVAPLAVAPQSYSCIPASEMKSTALYMKSVRMNYKPDHKEVHLQLHEEATLSWSTTLHMSALTLAQDLESLRTSLKRSVTEESPKSKEGSKVRALNICFQGVNTFEFVLSHSHRIQFVTLDLHIKVKPSQKSVHTENLIVYFDEHPVFTFQQVQYMAIPSGEKSSINRNATKGLSQQHNKLWTLVIDEMQVVFPYQYNFAEVFSEEAVNIVKWIKLVHKRAKKPFTEDSPLPSDFSIKAKNLTVELGDDPFEVKLRNNYELLEDEYHESLKRKKMLDEKIETFRKTHLMLPASKVNELYATLTKKNADIYIQRSKQLYSGAPLRSRLVRWHFEQFELLALADPSYHGTQRVVELIQHLDPESPYPEEGLEFSTLWCRKVNGSIKAVTCQLRDFPQLLLDWRDFNWWGTLAGAEQEASHRAKRTSVVEVGYPWSNMTVERSMSSLKFYHDLTWDLGYLSMTYGSCWDPVVAQVNLALERVNRPSADLSPPLAWWDKARLLLHGRLTVSARQLSMLQHVSLHPYNDTELFEVAWTDAIVDWTNGKIIMKGNLDMYVHTASRYNESRLLHIPNLKVNMKFNWLCLGNPQDHHSIMPCAPDKVPEYSSNQEHDSYRAFRSQNLNLSMSLETKMAALETADSIPTLLLYSSTLKWIESLKAILGGQPKLTRRGPLFDNVKPRKTQLTRHVKSLQLAVALHKFQVCYWTSLAKQHGFELLAGRLQLSSEHGLTLEPVRDGLLHRPRANWSVVYMNCELGDSEVWLYNTSSESAAGDQAGAGEQQEAEGLGEPSSREDRAGGAEPQAPLPPQRRYFLSVSRVSYGRETKVRTTGVAALTEEEDTPTHLLAVHGLRGAWTKHNRDVVFGLFDSYVGAKLLRRNLSTDALRGFRVDAQPLASPEMRPSPRPARRGASPAVSMLQQLVSESSGPRTVYTEDVEGPGTEEEQLHGVAACQANDVLHKNWLVELVNSQVMLRGCETSGYVIVSAAKAQILQRLHSPVWKENTLVSKTTWVGSLDFMQYYATVDVGERGPSEDGVVWLTLDNIEERASTVINDLPDLVGSGQGVGGVVSNTVGGASDPNTAPLQLQRIISRCGCQFFYASYGENIDPDGLEEVPPLPDEEEEEPWGREAAVDAFTLTHHDLEVCSNPLQYAMVLDLVNNLLLYVEPRRREANERLQRMRFRLQLSAGEDHRTPILQLQDQVRSLLSMQRHLEREAYQVQRSLNDDPGNPDLEADLAHLEHEIHECKEKLSASSKELAMIISCYRETQVAALKTHQRASSHDQEVSVVRRAEVCFKHAHWRLTDVDGQLGIADLVLSNFLYSRLTKSNDSVEHLLELGNMKVTNLLPNQAYKEVLQPTELQPHVPLERQRALRIFCRVRAPVGGISVKEHLEVNLVPITIGLTHAFTRRMLRFFFLTRDTEKSEDHLEEEPKPVTHTRRARRSQQPPASTSRDDIEKMKERAEKNQTFLYIKIPEVPLRLSYKGEKEKNLEDLNECSLVLPTIELHNRTCTWLDLLMVIKNDARKVLLSQAIKQKLQIKSHQQQPQQQQGSSSEDSSQPQEEDKARLLLGAKLLGGPEKSTKKRFF